MSSIIRIRSGSNMNYESENMKGNLVSGEEILKAPAPLRSVCKNDPNRIRGKGLFDFFYDSLFTSSINVAAVRGTDGEKEVKDITREKKKADDGKFTKKSKSPTEPALLPGNVLFAGFFTTSLLWAYFQKKV